MSKSADDYDFEGVDDDKQGDNDGKQQQQAPADTLQDKVNAIVSKMTQKEDGSWDLPADVSGQYDSTQGLVSKWNANVDIQGALRKRPSASLV